MPEIIWDIFFIVCQFFSFRWNGVITPHGFVFISTASLLSVIIFIPSILGCISVKMHWFIHPTLTPSSCMHVCYQNKNILYMTLLTVLTLSMTVVLSPLSYSTWLTKLQRTEEIHKSLCVCSSQHVFWQTSSPLTSFALDLPPNSFSFDPV